MAKRKPAPKKIEIINMHLSLRQVKRTSQDIQSWRNAITMAEQPDMPRRYKLYDLYADILLDGHLTSIIDKRINAVLNLPLQFVEQGTINEDITTLANSEPFLFVIREILNSKFWGHTLLEFSFAPFSTKLIPRKHVVPEKGWIIKEQTDTSPLYLYREPPFSYWLLEVGQPDDLGLLLKAAQYVIYKRGGFGDWAQFSEIFGMPFRIGRYESYDEETRYKLEEALQEAGSAAWAVIPKESDIEFVSNTTNANGQVYKDLIQSCNNELSKLILGNTLTTEHQNNGARALGQVHMDAENQIHQADKKFILNILNSKFKELLEIHGYNTGKGEFIFAETDKIDLKERLTMDIQLSQIVPIDDDYWYETYNLPKPKTIHKPKEPKKEPTNQKKKPIFPFFSKTKITNEFYDTIIEGKVEPIPAYDRRQITKQANQLYLSIYKQDKIPKKQLYKLVEATGNLLSEKSFFAAFPDLESFSEKELKKIIALRYNLWQFSAAKSIQQAEKYYSLLYDDNGLKKPIKDFIPLAKQVNNTYNNIWLRTEYNTVLNSAFVSRKYIEAQRNKDLFPYLQYKTAHDERVRNSHQKLDGVIKPVDDPFWDTYLPPNGYNCRCTVIKLSEATPTPDTNIEYPDVPQEFRKNPVKQEKVFSQNHNYFKGVEKNEITRLANKRFNLKKYLYNLDTYLSLIKKENILPIEKAPIKSGFDRKTGGFVLFEKKNDFAIKSEKQFVNFALKNGDSIVFLAKENPKMKHIDGLYNNKLSEFKLLKAKNIKKRIEKNIYNANSKAIALNTKTNLIIYVDMKLKRKKLLINFVRAYNSFVKNNSKKVRIENIYLILENKIYKMKTRQS